MRLSSKLDLNLVLYEPEIPQNTGNIMRLCVNCGATLHLIKPLAFEVTDKKLKRAGLDYKERSNFIVYDSFYHFLDKNNPDSLYFATTKTKNCYTSVSYVNKAYIVFGPESRGLPDSMLEKYHECLITIPMRPAGRSLNLATAASIISYEAWRQHDFL